ncbi:MAG: IPT/TIG domain-containing protein, partial [Candidatus Firestonebacteria bacterium]
LKLDDTDNTSLSGYSVLSDTEITGAVLPPGVKAGTYNLLAANSGGANSVSGVKLTVTGLAPTVSGTTPVSGSNLAAKTITINGTKFFGGSANSDVKGIRLADANNTQVAAYSVLSDTQIGAIIPAGIKAGSYDIRVTTGSGSNTTSAQKYIVTTVLPVLTSVNAAWGGNTGPVTVTITGSGFLGGTVNADIRQIRITDTNNIQASGWLVINDSLVRNVVIPQGAAAGTWQIKVTTGGGESTSAIAFTVKQGPRVDALSPASGKNTGQTMMDILGLGFFGGTGSNNVTSIRLTDTAGTSLTGYTVIGDGYLSGSVVQAKLVSGTYDVRVTTSIGTNLTRAAKFVVEPADKPKVDNVFPTEIFNNGTQAISVRGSGFYGGTMLPDTISVYLDDVQVAERPGYSGPDFSPYAVASDTALNSLIIPPGITPGTYNVRVVTDAGVNDTSVVKLVIKYPPVLVTDLTPFSGLNNANTTISITGSGFYGGGSSGQITSIAMDDPGATAITAYSVVSDTLIEEAVIPSGLSSGRYNIKVVALSGSNVTSTVKFDVLLNHLVANTITTTEGITLTIPANTFTQDTAVIVSSTLSSTQLVSLADGTVNKDCKVRKEFKSLVREFTATNGAVITTGMKVTIIMYYGSTGINDPVLEKDFRIAFLNSNNRWEILPGVQTVDMVNKLIIAETTHFSFFRAVQKIGQSGSLNDVVVYPNPADLGTAAGGTVKFKNLTYNPTITIYTVSGEEVIKLEPNKVYSGNTVNDGVSGLAEWDGSNTGGEKVARGLYMFIIKDEAGERKIGKLVIK